MYRVKPLFMAAAQILLLPFAQSTSTVFHLHEDGFARAIIIGNDPEVNLVMINKEVYYAAFNPTLGFLQRHESFYQRMANRTIIVAAENYVPYVVIRASNNRTKLSGYIGDLWLIIERVLRFRTVIKRAGFLEGQAMLRSGAADVLLQPTVITGNNMGQYGFTRPVASSWYELYVRAPESKASSESHFTVWTPKLWIATLVTIVLLIVATRIMYKFGAFEENTCIHSDVDMLQLPQQQDRVGKGTLGICFLSVLGSICSEGFQLKPSSASGRLLMVTILLFSLLLYNSYSAVLMANLAVTNPALPFSNLDDVARKGTHALCVRNLSYAYMRLKEKESNEEVAPKWRDVVTRKPCGNDVDNRDLEAALCKWGVAVLETPSNMAVVTENASLPCQMKQIRGQYFAVPVSLELRVRFPYTSLINSYIHRLHSSGILHYLRTKWTTRSSEATEDESVPNTAVSLRHVQLILFLYAGSLVCSIVILVTEIAYFRKRCIQRVTA